MAEMQPRKGTYIGGEKRQTEVGGKSSLMVDAIFLTNQCVQNSEVIRVVGHHGELLGNDGRPVTMEEVERGETPGMSENPQLVCSQKSKRKFRCAWTGWSERRCKTVKDRAGGVF